MRCFEHILCVLWSTRHKIPRIKASIGLPVYHSVRIAGSTLDWFLRRPSWGVNTSQPKAGCPMETFFAKKKKKETNQFAADLYACLYNC